MSVFNTTSHSPTSPTLLPINDGGSTDTVVRKSDVSLLLDPASVSYSPDSFSISFGNGTVATAIGQGLTATSYIQVKAYIFQDSDLIRSCISHSAFTEQNCNILSTNTGCTITHIPTGNIVNFTSKLPTDRLWPFSVNSNGYSHTVVHNQLDAERTLHAWETFCCTPTSSFLKALRKSFFIYPGISAKMFYDNMPSRPTSSSGHLDRQRMHYKSRKPKIHFDNLPPDDPDPTFSSSETTTDIPTYFYSVLDPRADEIPGIYADGTGRFPFITASGYKLILVWEFYGFVDHFLLRDETAEEYQEAYSALIAFIHANGHFPKFVRFDMHGSQTHPLVKHSITDPGLEAQFLPPGPGGHRSNRAEGAIRHIKNHFIACLANADPTFPMSAADKLLPQVFLTYQLLSPWRPNPSMSSYQGFFGHTYDFNAHPLHIPGQKCIVFEDPQERQSFAVHGIHGFMLGPNLAGYRMWKCWILSTSATRTTDTVAMIDRPTDLPNASVSDVLYDAIQKTGSQLQDLITTLDTLTPTAAAEIKAREAADALAKSLNRLKIQFPQDDIDTAHTEDSDALQRVQETAAPQRVHVDPTVLPPTVPVRKARHYTWLPVSNSRVRQLRQAPYLDFIGRNFTDDGITWHIDGIYRK